MLAVGLEAETVQSQTRGIALGRCSGVPELPRLPSRTMDGWLSTLDFWLAKTERQQSAWPTRQGGSRAIVAAYVVDAGNVVVKAKRTGARTGIVDNASSARQRANICQMRRARRRAI